MCKNYPEVDIYPKWEIRSYSGQNKHHRKLVIQIYLVSLLDYQYYESPLPLKLYGNFFLNIGFVL